MIYVLTGGASCGKTSVIEHLKEKGFNVLAETAKEVLREFPDWSYKKKQVEIFRRQTERENALGEEDVFMDRSVIDCQIYSKILLDRVPVKIKVKRRYDKIFILDRLPFVKNDVRIESDEEEAQKIHNALVEEYRSLGYKPVFVPVMNVDERVGFILDKIDKRC